MGAALVGMARHGGVLPLGGTFFVFLDYMRPPVRLAALSRAKAMFVFTHDSVGVGEDGPTHQPVEHLAIAAGDPRAAGDPAGRRQRDGGGVAGRGGPRRPDGARAVPPGHPRVHRRLGRRARRRRRPRRRPTRPWSWSRTGSEVAVALDAAEALAGDGIAAARRQPAAAGTASPPRTPTYRASVLPPGVPVLSVEAATTFGWERYADDSHRDRPLRRERPR